MRNVAVALFFGLLIACATGYQTRGLTGGFSETQLAPNIWEVRFSGNGYTSSERASDFVLLRTAELMLENGYEYFAVVDSQSEARAYTATTSSSSQTTISGRTDPVTGNVSATANTQNFGGRAYTVYKPSNNVMAVGLEGETTGDSLVFSARFLMNSLTEKYGLSLD